MAITWSKSLIAFGIFLSFCKYGVAVSEKEDPNSETYVRYFKMPGAVPKKDDDYVCTGMALNSTSEEWIIKYEPLASANRAHHMLLYGCSNIPKKHLNSKYWDCGHHGICQGNKIMYAWAKNAPGTHLPDGVGFRISGNSPVKYLALQIHYAKTLPEGVSDESGLKMTITKESQKNLAGIYLLVAGFVDIPPLTPKTHADVNCQLGSKMPEPINIFGFRVHAHTLGSVITGYKYDPKTLQLMEIVKGNPQWPQAFYPMDSVVNVRLDEILHARCTYNSTTRDRHTYMGQTSNDEMCNLYLMYYTDRIKGSESGVCSGEHFPLLTKQLPADSDEPLPSNELLEAMTKGDNVNKDKEILYGDTLSATAPEQLGFNAEKALKAYVSKPGFKQTTGQTYHKKFQMPGVTPTDHDAYICTPMILNSTQEEWVVLFNPLASANRAHHMLLFGCSDVNRDFLVKGAWDCGHHGVCGGGRIMYAWAKNAPATHLPKDVGFRMGGSSGVNFLVLQIHYVDPLPPGVKDTSGLEMTVTTVPQKYKAGIFLLAASYVDIPPFTEKTHADVNCLVGSTEPTDIFVFAFRVHAHKLGSVISGYTYDPQTNDLIEIVKGNPQWPQAFYPMDKLERVKPSDLIHARCTYNSSGCVNHTYIGSTAGDEMCNLYLMYYTDTRKGSESGGCGGEMYHTLTAALPPSSDEPLPPNPLLEEMTHGKNRNKGKEVTYANVFVSEPPIEVEKKTQSRKDPERPAESDKYELKPKPVEVYEGDYEDSSGNLGRVQYIQKDSDKKVSDERSKETLVSSPKSGKQMDADAKGFHLVENWGPANYKLGQVSAVAVDSRGDVVIFHRGDRVWDGSTFRGDVLADQRNPISQGTLLHLQRTDGAIMHEWGANFFFMPHGLSLDQDDNLWLTDVGLHQVFKFPPGFGEGKALLTLGTRFTPGTDNKHFCKPTGVAVMDNGDFFVSDGYCNSRIIHYSPEAKIIQKIGTDPWSPGLSNIALKSPSESSFRIPHALTLAKDHNEICVADRENGRVQCFKIDTGKFQREFKFKQWGRRLFSVAYTPHSGGKLFAVNGPQFLVKQKVEVYEINYMDGKLTTSFSPFNQGLSNPHDLAISANGTELYVVEIGPNVIWKFLSDSATRNRSGTSLKGNQQNLEVKTGQLREASPNTLSLFSGGYSSLGVSSVVLGLIAMPIIVLSLLAIIMKCRGRGTRSRYLDNNKFISGSNGKHKSGVGLNLGSLLNKRHGFEQVATNDIDDDDLDSADSDVEEFSLAATKV